MRMMVDGEDGQRRQHRSLQTLSSLYYLNFLINSIFNIFIVMILYLPTSSVSNNLSVVMGPINIVGCQQTIAHWSVHFSISSSNRRPTLIMQSFATTICFQSLQCRGTIVDWNFCSWFIFCHYCSHTVHCSNILPSHASRQSWCFEILHVLPS